MARLGITHATHYAYGAAVSFSQHLLRLLPSDVPGQAVRAARVTCDPAPDEEIRLSDGFGNTVLVATITQPHTALTVRATSRIERAPAPSVDFDGSAAWERVVAAARRPEGLAAAPFAFPTDYTMPDGAIEAYAAASFPAGRPVLAGARDLTARIHRDFAYVPGATSTGTRAIESFAVREGVCQDFAHVMLAGLRALGIPGRYRSGYIRTIPPEEGTALVGADATHAWVSVWDPTAGWVDFDPTNDLIPGEDHATLACGRDYADAAPITGIVTGSGGQTLSVAVTVTREADDAAA